MYNIKSLQVQMITAYQTSKEDRNVYAFLSAIKIRSLFIGRVLCVLGTRVSKVWPESSGTQSREIR